MKTQPMLSVLFVWVLLASACSPVPAATQPVTTQAVLPNTGPTQLPAASPQSAAPQPVAPDPARLAAVAKSYVETVNTGDFDKALDFYAPDAVVLNPLGLFIGREQIAGWLKQDVQTTRATPGGTTVQGPLVVMTGTVSLARFKQAGIDLVNFRSEFLVGPDGKIHYFSPTVLLTPEQQATMKAKGAGGPSPTPAVDPIGTVKTYMDAANAGNFDQALSFYADDSAALVMNGNLLLPNHQAIAGWLKQDVQTTRSTPQEFQMAGNLVVSTGTVSLARLKAVGIDSAPYRAVFLVENGKIRWFSPRLILTPQQQALLAAAPKP